MIEKAEELERSVAYWIEAAEELRKSHPKEGRRKAELKAAIEYCEGMAAEVTAEHAFE